MVMSFFGHKSRGKGGFLGGDKCQFYVEFLGWMECRGLRGKRYTEPVLQELRRRRRKMDKPPKITIQLTGRDLRISQDLEERKSAHGIRKVQFPPIPSSDVTYAVQNAVQNAKPKKGHGGENKLDDTVSCIYLGYMPRTQRWVHVHVYRFDEPSTASTFVRLMSALVDANLTRINEVERILSDKGEIDIPNHAMWETLSDSPTTNTAGIGTDSAAGSNYSDDEDKGGDSIALCNDVEDELRSLCDVREFDHVAMELRKRLNIDDTKPLLLPPKDYDTISRASGNLRNINERRCLNYGIVGPNADLPRKDVVPDAISNARFKKNIADMKDASKGSTGHCIMKSFNELKIVSPSFPNDVNFRHSKKSEELSLSNSPDIKQSTSRESVKMDSFCSTSQVPKAYGCMSSRSSNLSTHSSRNSNLSEYDRKINSDCRDVDSSLPPRDYDDFDDDVALCARSRETHSQGSEISKEMTYLLTLPGSSPASSYKSDHKHCNSRTSDINSPLSEEIRHPNDRRSARHANHNCISTRRPNSAFAAFDMSSKKYNFYH